MNSGKTPLINRVAFGFITFIWILTFLKIPYLHSLGRNVPPFAPWAVFFVPFTIGLVLIAIKGDIRLRLYRIWTPVGLAIIFWAWLVLFMVDVRAANGDIIKALLSQSSEVYLFITAFGLFLAFVDLKALYRYAYWFIPLTIFNFIFLIAAIYAIFSGTNILPAAPLGKGDFFFTWGRIIEAFLWYASGTVFAYFIVKRLRAERLGWKKIGKAVGVFIVFALLIVFLSGMIGNSLPKDNRFGSWLIGSNRNQ